MKSWADDASDTDSAPSEVIVDVETASDTVQAVTKYRARFVDHKSVQARHLYTLFGQLITDDDGNPLSVWTSELNNVLKKTLHHVHFPGRPGFGIFVTSKKHVAVLRDAMATGYCDVDVDLHVYPDEPGWIAPQIKPRNHRRNGPSRTAW